MKQENLFKKIIFGYDKLEEVVLCLSLVATTLIIFMQIIMRSVFNSSLTWSEELTRYIFIWQIWLGVSIAQKQKQHIRVELLFSIFKSEKFKDVIEIIATLIMIAFNIFLIYYGIEVVMQMISRGNLSGAMRMPMWYVFLSLPVASSIFCLRLVGQLFTDVKDLIGKTSKGGEE